MTFYCLLVLGGFDISANISNFVDPARNHCVSNIVSGYSERASLVDTYALSGLEHCEVSFSIIKNNMHKLSLAVSQVPLHSLGTSVHEFICLIASLEQEISQMLPAASKKK